MRYMTFLIVLIATALLAFLGATVSPGYLWPLVVLMPLSLLGTWELFLQRKHSLLRNYPLLAQIRWLFEAIRPEMQQYFIESDSDGKPFNRNDRSQIYERAKDVNQEHAFGTERDVYEDGYEWFTHSIVPRPASTEPIKQRIGGPACKQPYDMALLNVSAMSFGALSKNAILALNKGAKMGGFAHDTGEGGLTEYHLRHGGDLVWEIGSGYFGTRTKSGAFDPEKFADQAQREEVKCVSIKLSQGAKPGLGGVMPAEKVTSEIAKIRGVPVGQACISPAYHSAFKTPRELIEFVQRLRELCGAKPVGFKLCIGRREEFLSICKAMLELEVYPDFIIVDGAEGGTGAAPLEYEDHVGTPLTEGLLFVHDALLGAGLRDYIKVGCSGKVTAAFNIARRITQGADYCNAARAMMFALGCIQSQRCHTNTCPVGVATQDPRRVRALDIEDKATRVHNYQRNTVAELHQLLASLGLDHPDQLTRSLLMRRIDANTVKSYAEIRPELKPGALLNENELISPQWRKEWNAASADQFGPPR